MSARSRSTCRATVRAASSRRSCASGSGACPGSRSMVLSLSAKGLTTGEISAHLAEVYGAERVPADDLHDHRQGHGRHGRVAEPAAGPGLSGDVHRRLHVKIRDGKVANRPDLRRLGGDCLHVEAEAPGRAHRGRLREPGRLARRGSAPRLGDREQGDEGRQEERLGPREEDLQNLLTKGWPDRRPRVGLAAEGRPLGLGEEGRRDPETARLQFGAEARLWPCDTEERPRAEPKPVGGASRRVLSGGAMLRGSTTVFAPLEAVPWVECVVDPGLIHAK